jgi:hypothetical protein
MYPVAVRRHGWTVRLQKNPALWRKRHGLKETEAGITVKLKRATFTTIFFLACIAALELEQVVLEEI